MHWLPLPLKRVPEDHLEVSEIACCLCYFVQAQLKSLSHQVWNWLWEGSVRIEPMTLRVGSEILDEGGVL